jgi:hypothetical protein
VLPFGFAPGIDSMKNRLPHQERRFSIGRGDFLLFGSFDPHIAWVFPSKPPWDFLQFLGRHPDPPNAATGIPDVDTCILQIPTVSKHELCHKLTVLLRVSKAFHRKINSIADI